MTSNWQKYRLDDLIKVKHGFAFKGDFFSEEPTNDILLTPGNFKIGGGFKTDKFKYYNGHVPKDYILKENDILITMTDLSKAGDTLGYAAKIPPHSEIRYLHNQRLGLVQFKNDNFDRDYLYWLLRTREYQYYILGSATGSTVKHTSPSRIEDYEFEAPSDLSEQKRIATILSSLDDKIELNNQMNQTLESMAQAIFKEWFVDFNFPGFDGELVDGLPKGWRMGKISDIADVGSSKRIFREEYRSDGIPFFRGKEITQLSNNGAFTSEFFISEEKYLEIKDKFEVPKFGDLLITSVGTIGSVWFVDNEAPFYFKDGNVTWIKNYLEDYFKYYVFEWFKTDGAKEQIIRLTIGSTQKALTISALKNVELLIPDANTLQRFNTLLTSISIKRILNVKDIDTLTELRDSILPKLMSGKIEVNQ